MEITIRQWRKLLKPSRVRSKHCEATIVQAYDYKYWDIKEHGKLVCQVSTIEELLGWFLDEDTVEIEV